MDTLLTDELGMFAVAAAAARVCVCARKCADFCLTNSLVLSLMLAMELTSGANMAVCVRQRQTTGFCSIQSPCSLARSLAQTLELSSECEKGAASSPFLCGFLARATCIDESALAPY